MNTVPRVSIVVPFLNPGKFLRDAIESVRAQTYDSWELILVDDGSSDCSVQLARDYAAAYPKKIYYLQHPDRKNHGMSASRNLGNAHARGEFIANLDADDVFVADKLERQVSILDKYSDVAMTFGPMSVWCSWQGGVDKVQPLTCAVNSLLRPPKFVSYLLSGKNDPHGYLIRRTAIERVGGYADHVSMCEDWVLYVKIALTYEIHVESQCNYYYRQHAQQTCSVRQSASCFYTEYVPFFEWLEAYLKSTGCADEEVRRAFLLAVRRNRFDRVKEAALRFIRPTLTRIAASRLHQ